MFGITQDQLKSLLTSSAPVIIAAVISAAAFVSQLVGGMLADAKIYQDDRNWVSKIAGPIFIISFLASPALVVARLLDADHIRFWSWQGLRALELVIMQAVLFVFDAVYSEQKNNRRSPIFDWLRKAAGTTEVDWFKHINRLATYIPNLLPFVVGILIYICAPEVMGGGIVWPTYFVCQLFLTFILIIALHVTLQVNTGKANIYFRGGASTMIDAILLKVNEKNIRVIYQGSAYILNMDDVSRVEMRLDPSTRFDEDVLRSKFPTKPLPTLPDIGDVPKEDATIATDGPSPRD